MILNTNNTALLIAGPFHQNSLRMIEYYLDKFESIIVSTYNDKNNNFLKILKNKFLEYQNLQIIENDLPSINNYHNSQNIYYQCFSVVNGLEKCNTKFVIKLRSDEFYSNLNYIINILPSDKISTCNVFVRDVSYKPFHLSDHIIVGGVELLKNTYDNLKNYIELNSKSDVLSILNDTTPAETKIFLFAFFNSINRCIYDWNKLTPEQVYTNMIKYFYIFDVDSLNPYIVKSSVVGEINDYKQFVKNDTKLYLNYANNIQDLTVKSVFEKLLIRIKYKMKKILHEK